MVSILRLPSYRRSIELFATTRDRHDSVIVQSQKIVENIFITLIFIPCMNIKCMFISLPKRMKSVCSIISISLIFVVI